VLAFVARRLVATSAVLFGLSLLLFALSVAALGDAAPGAPTPGSEPAGPGAGRPEAASPEAADAPPVWARYGVWLGRLLQGDLGRSLDQQRPVAELVAERLPATVRLTLAAFLMALLLGVVVGTIAAVTRGGAIDLLLMAGALLGVSTPVIWLGLVLILVFSVWLDWLPAAGAGDGGWRHLILPAVALGALHAGVIARTVRASLVLAFRQAYVRTARAKGLSEARVLVKHGLRNALAAMLTATGIGLADLLVGAPLTESVFGWPGLGRLLVTAVGQRDVPVVTAAVGLFGLLHVVGTLLIDLAHAVADPRLRQ
jgi:peptide/nickel transport system permease protein